MSDFPKSPFWDFSLQVYARPGVAEASTGLQDRLGLDVNILLFCCWAGACGQAIQEAEMNRLIEAVRHWRDGVIGPLRALRRWLKQNRGAPSAMQETVRREVKALELKAERVEHEILSQTLPVTVKAPVNPDRLAAQNLGAYLLASGADADEADLADLGKILTAAFPDAAFDDGLGLLGRGSEPVSRPN